MYRGSFFSVVLQKLATSDRFGLFEGPCDSVRPQDVISDVAYPRHYDSTQSAFRWPGNPLPVRVLVLLLVWLPQQGYRSSGS